MNTHDEYEPRVRLYCAQPEQPEPVLRPDLSTRRAAAILQNRTKWANGTVLHYAFMDEGGDVGGQEQLEEVRHAFGKWKSLGIGLDFREVDDLDESEIRIAFSEAEGSKSTVGRDALTVGTDEPTTHYGWPLDTPDGRSTALHELGHVIGLSHEHQNPNAGIEWDDEAVYAELAGPPNEWPREVTFHNILRKLRRSQVLDSPWDSDSVMEYGFPPGLIVQPERYGREGIPEPLDISAVDKDRVLQWYPPLVARPARLEPFQSHPLRLSSGEQADFEIVPTETRKYVLGAFGASDFVMVLFEERDGELRYLAGDDDSGQDRNGRLEVRLVRGRRYVARARLYSTWGSGGAALMYW
ncbi:matrixin family metalloprotease [Streptomyces sp. NPDC001858]